MSRTDKDSPYWVDAWWEAWHAGNCDRGDHCTLPAAPSGRFPDGSRTIWSTCHWYPDGGTYHSTPPRWYRRHRWYAGDRFRARTACDTARAEHRAVYRTGGNVDTEPPTAQHRHNATWDWM